RGAGAAVGGAGERLGRRRLRGAAHPAFRGRPPPGPAPRGAGAGEPAQPPRTQPSGARVPARDALAGGVLRRRGRVPGRVRPGAPRARRQGAAAGRRPAPLTPSGPGSAQKTARRSSTTTAPMPAEAGSVMIQARKIGRTSFQFAARLTIPTPSTAPIRMWVEETGRPSTDASSTTVAAASSAANPEEGCIAVSPVPTVWITLRPTNHRPETR